MIEHVRGDTRPPAPDRDALRATLRRLLRELCVVEDDNRRADILAEIRKASDLAPATNAPDRESVESLLDALAFPGGGG